MNFKRKKKQAAQSRTAEFLVRFTPEEKDRVDWAARAVHLSVVSYIRSVGLRRKLRAAGDRALIKDILLVHADVGRLGGLLKMWLAGEAAVVCHDRQQVRSVLAEVEQTQRILLVAARQAWRRRTGAAVPLADVEKETDGRREPPSTSPDRRRERRRVRVRVPVSPSEKEAVLLAAARVPAETTDEPLAPALYLRARALTYQRCLTMDPEQVARLQNENAEPSRTGQAFKETLVNSSFAGDPKPTEAALEVAHAQLIQLLACAEQLKRGR